MSDYDDVLPRNVQQAPSPSSAAGLNTFMWRCAYTLVLGFVGSLAVKYGLEQWRIWQNKNYRLAQRRRHGIPDDDHRPFNVAVADANNQRQDAARKAARTRSQKALRDRIVQEQRNLQQSRQRAGQTFAPLQNLQRQSSTASSNVSRHGTPSFVNTPSFTQTQSHYTQQHPAHVTFADGYNTSNNTVQLPTHSTLGRRNGPSILKTSMKRSHDNDNEESDHAYAEDDDVKRLRKEGEEFIDGDEETEWAERVRGSKRRPDDDHIRSSKGKRQRKVSLESQSDEGFDEEMDVDAEEDADRVMEMPPPVRGMKRGRTSSNFGTDDYDRPDEDDKERRRGKRRNRRTSDTGSSRGKKRDRDVDENVDEDDYEVPSKLSKKKKGRASRSVEQGDFDEDMEDDGSANSDQNREIGERWTTNGISYKIGPNGQKLREAFVREDRPKYTMPADSDHADSRVNVRYVWREWLTETEYEEAQEQGKLAKPDEQITDSQPPTPIATKSPATPARNGKRLLWQSAIGTPTVKTEEKPSTPITSGPDSPKPYSGRRITMTGLADSTNANASPRRVYTKWEKQDMEAMALERVRRATKGKEITAAPATTASTLVPSIAFPSSASEPKQPTAPAASTNGGFSLGPASGSSNPLFGKPDVKKEETPKMAPAPSSAPTQEKPKLLGIGFPSGGPKPAAGVEEKKEQPVSASNGFFAKPAASSTPSAAPSNALFGKPTASPAPAPPSSAPPSNFFTRPADKPATEPPTTSATQAPSSNPLFSRMSGSTAPVAASAPSTNNTPASSSAPGPSNPSNTNIKFSFGKPGGSAFPSMQPSTAPATLTTAPAGVSPASTAPLKPASQDASKPQSSAGKPFFSFGMGKPADTDAKAKEGSAPPATNATAPASVKASSPFAAPNTEKKESSAPPGFSGFSQASKDATGTQQNPSPFGTGATSTQSAFGTPPSQQSAFGSTSAFGTKPTSFGTDAPKNTNFNGTTQDAFATKSDASNTTPATKSAFSFGQPSSSTPKSPFSTSSSGSATPQPFGAPTTQENKDTTPSSTGNFSFGNPGAASSATKPSFGFGGAGSTSAFGGSSAFGASGSAPKPVYGSDMSTAKKTEEAPTHAFGSASAFGDNTKTQPSPFGGASSNGEASKPSFGGFGASEASKPPMTNDQPKSVFGSSTFGNAAPSGGEVPKPTFAFGNTSNTTASSGSPFSFGGGASAGEKKDTAPATPMFGGAKTGAFTFGSGASTTPFGSPAPQKD